MIQRCLLALLTASLFGCTGNSSSDSTPSASDDNVITFVSGSVDARVSGFRGDTLSVDMSGSSHIEGQGLGYDFVFVDGSGSATLDMGATTALPGADVRLDGSSSVTVNLMDFANVTGDLSGSTTVNYYGSNINFDLRMRDGARIVRLGAAR